MLPGARIFHHRVRPVRQRPPIGDERETGSQRKSGQVSATEEVHSKKATGGLIQEMLGQEAIGQDGVGLDAQPSRGIESPTLEPARWTRSERAENRPRPLVSFGPGPCWGYRLDPWSIRLGESQLEPFDLSEQFASGQLHRVWTCIPRLRLPNCLRFCALEGSLRISGAIVAQRMAGHLPCGVANNFLKLELHANELAEKEAVKDQRDQDRQHEGEFQGCIAPVTQARAEHRFSAR